MTLANGAKQLVVQEALETIFKKWGILITRNHNDLFAK